MGVWKAEAGTPELVRLSSSTCPTEGLLQRFMLKRLCSMPNNATRASRRVSSEASHSAAIVRCGPTRKVPSVSVHFRLFSRDPTSYLLHYVLLPSRIACFLHSELTEISQLVSAKHFWRQRILLSFQGRPSLGRDLRLSSARS